MRLRADLTVDNLHTIDDSTLYMVNDLIFTSAGVMLRDPEIGVGKTGGNIWEQWDIDPFDPVPYGDVDAITKTGDDTGVADDIDDDQFHGDNVSW